MRVYIGSDHAGFELKAHLLQVLPGHGHDVVDVGPKAYHPDDDYPAHCIATGIAVVDDPGSLGVVIGGSGNGEQISANKVVGVRAALAWNPDTAQKAREHNDANVVSIGAREHTVDAATELVLAFLRTSFSGAERHQRRIDQVAAFEKTHQLPPLLD
jgi:ribose 5-phosphate isomerase B